MHPPFPGDRSTRAGKIDPSRQGESDCDSDLINVCLSHLLTQVDIFGGPRSAITGRQSSTCVYSITSSARASTECGISIPSALAAFRLMTNSKFVGCSTGKSAGFAPLSILST